MAPSAAAPPPPIALEVERILARLWADGHAAYVVGGALRDGLLGRAASDWDVATSARPEVVEQTFPGSHRDNRFGTVTVHGVQITTFRRDHRYSDHRRPDEVTFSDRIEDDLARRDFTINAIAWGRTADAPSSGWVDPHAGGADLDRRLLRAVGDPGARFDEDALRLLRAVRLASQLEFSLEPATRAAVERSVDLARHVSGDRIGQELLKLLAAPHPGRGLELLADTGLLEVVFPELAAQRGVAQNKPSGGDLWQHTVRTVEAAALPPRRRRVVLAALMHDIGKPATFRDGRFMHHDRVGAELATGLLARLSLPRRDAEPVVALVRLHMFAYQPAWSDAAVRRFIVRVGRGLVDDLIRLRQADNVGSGLPPDAGRLDELRERVRTELAAARPLTLRDLAVDGDDLQAELGLEPGPALGDVLDRLLEAVLDDPARNERAELLRVARDWVRERDRRLPGGAVGSTPAALRR